MKHECYNLLIQNKNTLWKPPSNEINKTKAFLTARAPCTFAFLWWWWYCYLELLLILQVKIFSLKKKRYNLSKQECKISTSLSTYNQIPKFLSIKWVYSCLSFCTKLNSKWIKGLSTRFNILNPIKEKVELSAQDPHNTIIKINN